MPTLRTLCAQRPSRGARALACLVSSLAVLQAGCPTGSGIQAFQPDAEIADGGALDASPSDHPVGLDTQAMADRDLGDSSGAADASLDDGGSGPDSAPPSDAQVADLAAPDSQSPDTYVEDSAPPDPCLPNPCTENNRQRCVDNAGEALCLCDEGMTDYGDGRCLPLDPCAVNPCADPHRGLCLNADGTALCSCDPDYLDFGDGSCRPADPCAPNPCAELNRGVCAASLGQASCYCDDGFVDWGGGACQPVVSCDLNPCTEPNRGQCSVSGSVVHCACDPSFVDDGQGGCVSDGTDPCSPNPCTDANRGVCSELQGQPVCACDPGFEETGLGGCQAIPTAPCAADACGTAISGRVTHGGAALPGMTVSVYSGDCPLGTFAGSTRTDGDGFYVVDGLSAGVDYFVRSAIGSEARWYNAAGGSSVCLARQALQLIDGQSLTGADIVYPPGGAIAGRVNATSGGVGPGLRVQFYRQICGSNVLSTEVLTDASGSYLATGLPVGAYYVEACASCRAGFSAYANRWYAPGNGSSDCNAAAQVTVNAHQLTSGVDISVETPAEITGLTLLSAAAVSGVLVHAYDGPCDSGSYLGGAYSASDGRYHLANLPAGTVYLETRMRNLVSPRLVDRWWTAAGGSVDCNQAEGSTLASGDLLTGRDFSLTAGGSVSGAVSASAAPVVGAHVWAHVEDCARSDQRAWFQPSTTDDSGSYQIRALPPGNVRVFITPRSAQPEVQGWYDGSTGVARCASGSLVHVSEGADTGGVDFAF